MPDPETFSKKIKELAFDDVEYNEDFFRTAFGDTDSSLVTLKQSAAQGSKRNITETYDDQDIDEEWMQENISYDGQLAVDVFQTDDEIIIVSTVAGVKKEDLEIDMNGDMITIKGVRRHKMEETRDDDYFIRECYWGGFSRSIILPVDIQHDEVKAALENGILTIRLPKSQRSHNGKIEVVEVED
ncbi:MAG: Hsp20/alpha crystallin family protein [Candidatus Kerfeldbacteria bacterium]